MSIVYPRFPTLFRVAINFNTSGDNTIIPADATRRIIIHRFWLVVGGATNLTFKDNLPSPAAVPLGQYGGITFDSTGEPWFITDINTAFIINSSSGVQVSGTCFYSLAV